MNCPTCKIEIKRELKKHRVFTCKCGANLMSVEIKKQKQLLDLKNYKGEK